MSESSSSSKAGLSLNSLRSRARSARSVSDCELTDTYSPAAIDMAPATSPATPAISTAFCVAAAAATPTIKLAVETIPSLAPSTAARSHPMRSTRWYSGCRRRRLIREPASRSEAPKQHQDDDDDQNSADESDAAMTETVAVAAEATTEATKQENDEDDNQDESKGHSAISF